MFENGVTPSKLDQENYLEILTIMKAKPREDRPLNAGDAHKRIARMMSKN